MATFSKQGTITRVIPDKGFGFIKPDATGPDVFFHFSKLIGATFNDGLRDKRVTYEAQDSDRGPRATHVELIEDNDR